jgi:DNA invertase Pin-like site-specific DNA recombinase
MVSKSTHLGTHERRTIIMKRYGYHRTSTKEQHLDRGIAEITAYCVQNGLELEKIYTDQQTGKNFNRPRYQVLKEDVLRCGDELIITEVDRLGRNKQDTLKELQYYRDNGIRVKILELPTTLMDMSKLDNAMARMIMETINNMLIELYAAMAQAEVEKKEKPQKEGIEAKRARGEWDDYGRPAVMPVEEFALKYQKVKSGELRPFELMKQLGMSKTTFYRYVAKMKM